jgi:hypothetical protein
MNMNDHPTEMQLRDILQACDEMPDSCILWVDRFGEVQATLLTTETPAEWVKRMDEKVQFRYATYAQNNGHVRESTHNNDLYVTSLFEKLVTDWQESSGHTDI